MAALLLALVVFGAVLAATPPGPRAVLDVLGGSARGPAGAASAYALGAAASLAVVALVMAAGLLWLLDAVSRVRARRTRAP